MVGKDLRCPLCSSFAEDVDPDYSIRDGESVKWTCEVGHVVLTERSVKAVTREKVIGFVARGSVAAKVRRRDPPKAEGGEA